MLARAFQSLGFGLALAAPGYVLCCGGKVSDSGDTGSLGTGGASHDTNASGGVDAMGGATPIADAATDAGECNLTKTMFALCGASQCCGVCNRTETNLAHMDYNCSLPLENPPPHVVTLIIDCTPAYPVTLGDLDGGRPPDDGWGIDYSTTPARLVFGASLCEELRARGDLFVFVAGTCSCIF
jgi:hypothetical protein